VCALKGITEWGLLILYTRLLYLRYAKRDARWVKTDPPSPEKDPRARKKTYMYARKPLHMTFIGLFWCIFIFSEQDLCARKETYTYHRRPMQKNVQTNVSAHFVQDSSKFITFDEFWFFQKETYKKQPLYTKEMLRGKFFFLQNEPYKNMHIHKGIYVVVYIYMPTQNKSGAPYGNTKWAIQI